MTDKKFLNNEQMKRYELHIDDRIAIAEYMVADEVVYITHTEVPVALEGRGIGSELIKKCLEEIRWQGRSVHPVCPFVASYIRKNPQWNSLVK